MVGRNGIKIELWQHISGDRYIVMSSEAGVQLAAGPLATADMKAVQKDEWAIPWAPGLERWVSANQHAFTVVWP